MTNAIRPPDGIHPALVDFVEALARRAAREVMQRAEACQPPIVRGLNRLQASAYVGVSPSLFDEMVKDGRMPRPKTINSRTVWDRKAVDRAFDLLPGGSHEEGGGEWDVET